MMDVDYLRRRRRRRDVGDPTLTLHQLFAGVSTLARAARKGPVVDWTRDTISGMGFNSSGVGVLAPHNLFDDSNNLDAATSNWAEVRLPNPVAAPDSDGGNNAFLMEVSATSPFGARIEQIINPDGAEGNNRIFSIEIIAKDPSTNPGTGWIQIIVANTDGDSFEGYYDIRNGTLGTLGTSGNVTAVPGAYTITALGVDGFYRCRFSGEITGGTTNYTCKFQIAEADGDRTVDEGDQVVFYQPMAVRGLAQNTYVENTGNTPKYDQPLFDHDPASSNNPLGVGIWEGVSQLCLRTQDFETTWSNIGGNTTITATAGAAPDSTTTATDVKHNDVDESIIQNITVTDNTVHCYSLFIHSGTTGTHDWVHIKYREGNAENGCEAWYDLTNAGAVGTSQLLGTGTLTATGVINVGGGWYRIWIAGKIPSGQTDGRVVFQNAVSDGSSTEESTNSVWYWGANLTATAFPLPYIAATTAAVTVDKDVGVVTDVSWHSGGAGTWFAKFSQPVLVAATKQVFHIDDGGTTDREMIFVDSSHRPSTQVVSSGGNNSLVTGTAILAGAEAKSAFAYTTDDLELFQDGSSEGTDSTVDFPTDALTTLRLGHLVGGSQVLNGHIAELRYYNVQKSDAFTKALTA